MVRFLIIGIVVAVAFTLYSLVDAAMTDGARARGVSKPVWVVLVVVLPVIGGVLWFMIGKGNTPAVRPSAPDDDPRFTGSRMSPGDMDTLRDLEARLRELDGETFPGEEPGGPAHGTGKPGGADDTETPDVPGAPKRPGPIDPGSRGDGDSAQS